MSKETVSHGNGVAIRKEMTSMSNKDICPITFLVHYATKLAGFVAPRRFWLASESLYSTKRGVLCNKNQTREEYVELGISHLNNNYPHMLASPEDRPWR